MIEELINTIPSTLMGRSGAVFYSGVDAFSGERDLYILGLNPGGSPEKQANDTVATNLQSILDKYPPNWSAYSDDSWRGSKPGTRGLQPRILHLLNELKLDPGQVPASNLIFVRSQRESNIATEAKELIEQCWPFHSTVIRKLKIKAILCFGKTVGQHVRQRLSANELIDEFVETNHRKWKSQAFKNENGIQVFVVTHPSISNWCVPATDPSKMIKRVLTSVT